MKTYKLLINNEHFEARLIQSYPCQINLNGTDYLVQIEEDKIQSVPSLLPRKKQFLWLLHSAVVPIFILEKFVLLFPE